MSRNKGNHQPKPHPNTDAAVARAQDQAAAREGLASSLEAAAQPTAEQVQSAAVASAVAESVPPMPAPPPALAIVQDEKPQPSAEVDDLGITLRHCTIELARYEFVNGQQVNKITPAEALIRHGVIAIPERNLIVPLSSVTLIRS